MQRSFAEFTLSVAEGLRTTCVNCLFHRPASSLSCAAHNQCFPYNLLDLNHRIGRNASAIGRARDFFDHAASHGASHLSNSLGRDGDADLGGRPLQVLDLHQARSLLAEQEPGKEIDQRGKDKPSSEAHGRAQTDSVPKADPDGAEPSESRHEAAHHATAQNTRPAVATCVMAHVVAEVAMLEDVAEEGARREEHEAENRNGQKRPKSGSAFK